MVIITDFKIFEYNLHRMRVEFKLVTDGMKFETSIPYVDESQKIPCRVSVAMTVINGYYDYYFKLKLKDWRHGKPRIQLGKREGGN